MFGVQAGDKLTLSITGPDGKVFLSENVDQPRNQARRYLWAGKRRTATEWPAGAYRGKVVVSRPNDKQGPGSYTAETVVEIR